MAHQQQIDFCNSVKSRFPEFFSGRLVLDVGSLDINGNNQYLFDGSLYIGVDLNEGRNVDFVSRGHDLALPDSSFDVVISTECFEHDRFYAETIRNCVRMLKPGGLFVFSCATTGRPEHGTRRTTPHDAPFIMAFDEWCDYYRNLDEHDIREVLDVEKVFESFEFSTNMQTCDLYFWGVKKGSLDFRSDYSAAVANEQRLAYVGALQEKIGAQDMRLSECYSTIQELQRESDVLGRRLDDQANANARLEADIEEIRQFIVSNDGGGATLHASLAESGRVLDLLRNMLAARDQEVARIINSRS